MKTPSIVGESAALIAVIDFMYWASTRTPGWASWLWVVFGAILIVDWMLGGITDKGVCKSALAARK